MRSVKEMRSVYRDFLIDTNKEDDRIVALEADLSSSMSTNNLNKVLGDRYINVGIMEAEMIGVAAGLSLSGFKPYIHTFGPFATRRVFDQVFISLAYAQLSATIIGSDAGVTAEMNGGTHMSFEDLGLMRLIPNSVVYEVCDDVQFDAILRKTINAKGLNYIRTDRKVPVPIYSGKEDFSKGFFKLREGDDLIIVTSGIMVSRCLKVADILKERGFSVSVIDLFRVKPVSDEVIKILQNHSILTVENHNVIGGLGSAISDLLCSYSDTPIVKMGVMEQFGQVGKVEFLLEKYGIDEESILKKSLEILKYKGDL